MYFERVVDAGLSKGICREEAGRLWGAIYVECNCQGEEVVARFSTLLVDDDLFLAYGFLKV